VKSRFKGRLIRQLAQALFASLHFYFDASDDDR
jgi:hypothetical protein